MGAADAERRGCNEHVRLCPASQGLAIPKSIAKTMLSEVHDLESHEYTTHV